MFHTVLCHHHLCPPDKSFVFVLWLLLLSFYEICVCVCVFMFSERLSGMFKLKTEVIYILDMSIYIQAFLDKSNLYLDIFCTVLKFNL